MKKTKLDKYIDSDNVYVVDDGDSIRIMVKSPAVEMEFSKNELAHVATFVKTSGKTVSLEISKGRIKKEPAFAIDDLQADVVNEIQSYLSYAQETFTRGSRGLFSTAKVFSLGVLGGVVLFYTVAVVIFSPQSNQTQALNSPTELTQPNRAPADKWVPK